LKRLHGKGNCRHQWRTSPIRSCLLKQAYGTTVRRSLTHSIAGFCRHQRNDQSPPLCGRRNRSGPSRSNAKRRSRWYRTFRLRRAASNLQRRSLARNPPSCRTGLVHGSKNPDWPHQSGLNPWCLELLGGFSGFGPVGAGMSCTILLPRCRVDSGTIGDWRVSISKRSRELLLLVEVYIRKASLHVLNSEYQTRIRSSSRNNYSQNNHPKLSTTNSYHHNDFSGCLHSQPHRRPSSPDHYGRGRIRHLFSFILVSRDDGGRESWPNSNGPLQFFILKVLICIIDIFPLLLFPP
jgi:hypothetical protein